MMAVGYLLAGAGVGIFAYALGAALTDIYYPVRRTNKWALAWGFFHIFHPVKP